MPYCFGRFELRVEDRALLQDGVMLDLRGRSIDLLRVLIEHRPRMVASDELLRLAWPRLAVGEGALAEEIAGLRHILGASAIPGGGGRGYRFNMALEGEAATGDANRRQVAILNADVVGSASDDRGTQELRALLHARVSDLVAAYGGQVVDCAGAVQAEFATARESLQCARAIQGERGYRAAPLPEALRGLIKIGLDAGEVQEHGQALRGDCLVVAARLRALGEPGGVCFSGAIFDQSQSDLGRNYRHAGGQPVRGIERPVRVYHLGADGPEQQFAEVLPDGGASASESESGEVYRFDQCEIRPSLRQVVVDGAPAKVGARALDILLLLVQHRDRVVSRAEIFERVWPRSVVVEGNLQVHVFALRKVLGAQAIATIPGRGYRFTRQLDAGGMLQAAPAGQAPVLEGAATAKPALRFKSNLPEAPAEMFGREADLAAMFALVSQHRLVTITGPGGIGKTRLAQRLAIDQQQAYRNGVSWVDLSGISDPNMVPSAVGSDLGVQLGQGDLLEALARSLKDAQVLIVLDNAEHLVDAVAITALKLLEQTKEVRLLVTSQVPLRAAREMQYRLGAMALPDEDELAPDEAMTYGAIQLFVERARAVERHFALDEHTLATVIDICRQLDAMPLAIEMAAARVGTLGLGRLAESLNERLRVLTGGAREAPRRQKTLRATMQWSHSLLQPQEMVVFRRLGVFRSGFSLELAQRVVADGNEGGTGTVGSTMGKEALDGWAVLEHLSTLVDRSLVAVDPGEYPRYRLLETARLFALENLEASHETSASTRRFAQAILARFVRREEDIWSGKTSVDAGIASLEPDLPNLREALKWSIANDAELAVGLASTLEHAVTNGRMEEMLATFDATEHLAQTTGEPLRARWALAYARNLNTERGLNARRWADFAFDFYSRLGPPQRRHLALASKLMCDLVGGHTVNDTEWLAIRDGASREWSDYVNSVGPRALALRAYYEGNFQAAMSAATEVLELAERCGSSLLIKSTRLDMAEFARCLGLLDESIRALVELVEVINPVRERNLAALAWINLFSTQLAAGHLGAAREAARRASEHCELAQVQHWWADGAALLAALEGRPRSAARLIGYADAIYHARSIVRQPNEAEFRRLAATESQQHLSTERFGQLLGLGARLSDEAAIRVGLGLGDS